MCTVAFGQFGEESRASGANGESQGAAQGPEESADGAVRGVSPQESHAASGWSGLYRMRLNVCETVSAGLILARKS